MLRKIKVNDLIDYKLIYGEKDKNIGLVCNIQKDFNFYNMITIFAKSKIMLVPESMIEYKILQKKKRKQCE